MTPTMLRQRLMIMTLLWASVAAGDPIELTPGEFTAKLNGLRLWYKVSGQGPVCIMPTPGWGPSSDLYFRTLTPLEDMFTVVYLDTRGTGRSARAASKIEYTWDHFVDDLEALREHLGQAKVWLMGHSEGGVHVMQYTLEHPDRVSGLILLTTHASMDQQRWIDVQRRMELRSNEPWYAEARKALETLGQATNADQWRKNLITVLPFYLSDVAKLPDCQKHWRAEWMSYDAFRGSIDSKRIPFTLVDQLGRIKAPTLIVVGDHDFICSPAAAQQLHLGIPNSKLLLIEDAGHFPWLEQPEAFFSGIRSFFPVLGLGQ